MRCKFISDARCKNKATDKYQGIAVCAEHKHYLEERVNIVLGGKKAVQQNAHLTPESLASSQAVSNASTIPQSDGDTPPLSNWSKSG